jgi:hypothetical protein
MRWYVNLIFCNEKRITKNACPETGNVSRRSHSI